MEHLNNEIVYNYTLKIFYGKLSIMKLRLNYRNVALFMLNNVENNTWQILETLYRVAYKFTLYYFVFWTVHFQ